MELQEIHMSNDKELSGRRVQPTVMTSGDTAFVDYHDLHPANEVSAAAGGALLGGALGAVIGAIAGGINPVTMEGVAQVNKKRGWHRCLKHLCW